MPAPPDPDRPARRRLPRHTKIFFGLVFGLLFGLFVHEVAGDAPWVDWVVDNVAYPIGQIFLRLIFMIVVPLVLSSPTSSAMRRRRSRTRSSRAESRSPSGSAS